MYLFHCEETRPLVSIFTHIDAMLLNLEALAPQPTKRKFVNLSVLKNFIRFQILKNLCNIKIKDYLLCQYAIYGPRKKSIIDKYSYLLLNSSFLISIFNEINSAQEVKLGTQYPFCLET